MKKLISIFMLLALAFTLAAPAFAESSVNGGTTEFTTYITLDKGANVPNMTVAYTIKPGKASAATTQVPAVKAGMTGAQLKADNGAKGTSTTVTFSPTDTTVTTGDTKTATHTVTVDLSAVSFTVPGIYRYEIAQTAGSDGVATDTATTTRYLDVYVTSNGSALAISAYVMHLDNKILSGGSYNTKQSGFGYSTKDLTISKTVSGNMAYRAEYFAITVTLTGAVKGTKYDVDLTSATNSENPSTVTIGNDGTATVTFFLKHGESVTIKGLTAATQFAVSEANGDYVATYKLNDDAAVSGNAVQSTAMGNKNNSVAFNNDKNVNAPTGVKTNVLVYASALAAVVLVGTTAIVAKKARKNED